MTAALFSGAARMQESARGGRDLLRAAASVESASLDLGRLLRSPTLRAMRDPVAALATGLPGLDALADALGRLEEPSGDAVRRGARPGATAPAVSAPGTSPTGRVRPGSPAREAHRTAGGGSRNRSGGEPTPVSDRAAVPRATARAADRTSAAPALVVPDPHGSRTGEPRGQVAGTGAGARVAAAIAGPAHTAPAWPRTTTGTLPARATLPAASTLPTLTTADLAAAAGLRTGSGRSAGSEPSSRATPLLPPTGEAPGEPDQPEARDRPVPRLPSAPSVLPTPTAAGALGELVTRWQQGAGSGTPTAATWADTGRPVTPTGHVDRPAVVDDQLTVDRVERAVDEMLRREAEQHGLTGVDR